MKTNRYVLIVSLVLISLSTATGQTCPPPPTSIDPSLDSKVSVDNANATYTYSYTMRNGIASLLPIHYFALSLNQQPSNIRSPLNWTSRYINLPQIAPSLRWATLTTGPSDSSDVGGSDLLTPMSAIQPGQHLAGFSLQSSRGPAIIQYFVEGFTQVPSGISTSTDDEPIPSCAGWDFVTPHLQTLVTGMSIGPSTPNVLSVRIRLRKQDGDKHYGVLNPQSATGNIGVLILSSRNFDASTISVSSIHFGPGRAAPLSSKLVSPRLGEDTRQDEREDWEKVREQLGDNDSQDGRYPNLLLIFDLNSLAVQCVLDKAIFLTGVTQSGANIIGGVSTKTVGCDVHKPGVRQQQLH